MASSSHARAARQNAYQLTERPGVSWAWYADGRRQPTDDFRHAVESARSDAGYVWLGLRDPSEELMDDVAMLFELHELASEDVIEGHKRSKLEAFDDSLFMVISTVDYVEHDKLTETSEIVSTGEIMVFLGSWYVITVRKGGRPQMRNLRRGFESDRAEMEMGPWRVLYRVLDLVIDDFAETGREMETDVGEVEAAVFAKDGTHEIERPYQLKRELIEFKRTVHPLQAPLTVLQTRPFPAIPEDARAYFRELGDHLLATRESIASLDEVLTSVLSAALTRTSVADNQDMRKISAAVAMLAVPTLIGAIYGMNFDNMPELHTKYGYFVVLGVMATGMLLVWLYFRRRRWL
ncbi:magnesium and cobalt transport protein CorA [Nigerium massiliense]|uniref:magnesium and cobalt transport protein CorA n=1 Tax=Nigerium massiliense TaxID=1522317 RepID=UPI000694ACD4|nr:magnesium and cobalt transport protein CorA [Nigerium massiliense]